MKGQDAFERAFVAVTYLLGRRPAPAPELGPWAGQSARKLSERLATSDQAERARALASELLPLVRALDARRLS